MRVWCKRTTYFKFIGIRSQNKRIFKEHENFSRRNICYLFLCFFLFSSKKKEEKMNKVVLMGRLTRDPEVRYSQGNNPIAIARYTLAVDRRFKKEGEPNADFINCVAFGHSGEFAERYLKQGTKIVISGRIQTGNYTNRDGQKVYTTEVVIEEHDFAESKTSSKGNGGQSQQTSQMDNQQMVGNPQMNNPQAQQAPQMPTAPGFGNPSGNGFVASKTSSKGNGGQSQQTPQMNNQQMVGNPQMNNPQMNNPQMNNPQAQQAPQMPTAPGFAAPSNGVSPTFQNGMNGFS